MSVRFVYFDLGNVLIRFSIHRLISQISAVVEAPEEDVRALLFDYQRYRLYEKGDMSTEDFFKQLCDGLNVHPNEQDLAHAINDVFWANDPMLPIVRKLAKLNVPRGILSNINPLHWEYIEEAFPRIWDFFPEHKIASFEARAIKPSPEIYKAAYEDAKKEIPDLQPNEVLFIDDLEDNVKGAADFGFQTIHYVEFDEFLVEYKKTGLPVPSRYLDENMNKTEEE